MRMNVMFLCVVLALAGFVTAADAQTGSTTGEWQFDLQLPRNTQTVLKGGEGMSWDQFRSNGLALNARGTGKLELVVFVLKVQDGRVIQRWSSSAFAASSGSRTIMGRQFPALKTMSANQASRVVRVTPAARAVDTATLIDSDNVAKIVPRDMAKSRLLMVFVAPQRTSSGSTTSPLFVDLEPLID